MRLFFCVALLSLAFATPAVAQNARPEATAPQCTDELFEDANRSFERRKLGSENLAQAERQLSKIVQLCRESVGGLQAQENLRAVQEELADNNLSIALFYLSRFYDGRGGKAGARSRLKSIVERYPDYSKLELVRFLLREIEMNDR